jgi:NAD(P)-dependent dehydrogenase (short-subunit alcohol dehydrogenase family)
MQGEKKVALVTGSSSGIGFETALLLSNSGFHTYASMRNPEKSRNITEIANTENLPLTVVQLDVNDDRSVKDAISKIINIVIIEPGVIKTNFVENSRSAHTTLKSESPYADLIGRTMKGFGVLMHNSSSPPKLVAEAILNAITSKEPEIRYLVGEDAKSIMKVRKSTSDKEFENWMYESILQEKGFMRANTVKVGSV